MSWVVTIHGVLGRLSGIGQKLPQLEKKAQRWFNPFPIGDIPAIFLTNWHLGLELIKSKMSVSKLENQKMQGQGWDISPKYLRQLSHPGLLWWKNLSTTFTIALVRKSAHRFASLRGWNISNKEFLIPDQIHHLVGQLSCQHGEPFFRCCPCESEKHVKWSYPLWEFHLPVICQRSHTCHIPVQNRPIVCRQIDCKGSWLHYFLIQIQGQH